MTTAIDWQNETLVYHRPHRRLVQMARLLKSRPGRRLLDVGCATGYLAELLGDDFTYFGCDVSDRGAEKIGIRNFRRIDFNESVELSYFENRRIDIVHIGGVLEYLNHPIGLLRSLRRIVAPGAELVVSIINFEAKKYASMEDWHPGWVYRPKVADVRKLLERSGWKVERQLPVVRRGGLKG